jgi:hypothetical protein
MTKPKPRREPRRRDDADMRGFLRRIQEPRASDKLLDDAEREVEAMRAILGALRPLKPDERVRVLTAARVLRGIDE